MFEKCPSGIAVAAVPMATAAAAADAPGRKLSRKNCSTLVEKLLEKNVLGVLPCDL